VSALDGPPARVLDIRVHAGQVAVAQAQVALAESRAAAIVELQHRHARPGRKHLHQRVVAGVVACRRAAVQE